MKNFNDFMKNKFPAINFENEDRLIEEGIIDSLDLFKLVNDLEEEYKVSIPFDDVIINNFKSLKAISSLISRLLTE